MLTSHRWAVVAACSLPPLLAGCATAAPDANADVARVAPTKATAPTAADHITTDSVDEPHSNPVPVSVTGRVLGTAGRPMRGAAISVRRAATSRDCVSCGGASAVTDAAGRFALVLTRGTYLMTCEVTGGLVCRIEGEAVPGLFTVTSGTRNLLLVADRVHGAQ